MDFIQILKTVSK